MQMENYFASVFLMDAFLTRRSGARVGSPSEQGSGAENLRHGTGRTPWEQ